MYEVWKDIPGFEGIYQISNCGNIQSLARHKIHKSNKALIPTIKKNGYKEIGLRCHNKRSIYQIHRLVVETFLPDKTLFQSMIGEDRKKINLDKLEVNHKDGNPSNNCVDNLEWCTHLYNCNYGTIRLKRRKNSLRLHSEKNFQKYTESLKKQVVQYDENNKIIAVYKSLREASRATNINSGRICEICKGKRTHYKGYRFKYESEAMPNA